MFSSGESISSRTRPYNILPGRGGRYAGLTLALGVALTGNTACADNADTPPNSATMVTTYKGRDLLCRTAQVTINVTAYDCDFAGYYAEPDYRAPAEIERIDADQLKPQTFPYLQGEVDCLVFNYNVRQTGSTCDYPGYLQAKANS